MSQRICFPMPDGRRICVDIPILAPWPPPWWHGPRPPGPDPDPWLHGEGIKPDAIRELQALATLHAIAGQFSVHGRDLQAQIKRQAESIELPKGVSVTFEPTTAAR